MKTAKDLINSAIEEWRLNKGIGTILVPVPLDNRAMVAGVLQRIYNKSPTIKTLIVTNVWDTRDSIINFLTNQECEENNKEFQSLLDNKILRVLTLSYIERYEYNYETPSLIVCLNCDIYPERLIKLINIAKHKLVCLQHNITDFKQTIELYKVCPMLSDINQNELDGVRTNLPVEEYWIDVNIPITSNEFSKLTQYNEYITTSLTIFGGFDVMNEARTGNVKLNISAWQVCNNIAQENGWNDHLDMNIEMNVELDKLYNPINLKERASQTYEMIRNRSTLLSDFEGKLEKILEIVSKINPLSKILIINARGEFAAKVTDYINKYSECTICANYHDRVDSIPDTDNYGRPLLYKSGKRKGEIRMLGAQAQMTKNAKAFSDKLSNIRILSTNKAPNKELCAEVDVVIITSPICDTIENYFYRLSKVQFNCNKVELYSIYCKSTLEEKRLQHKPIVETHQIVNKSKYSEVSNEISDFLVVD